MRQLIILLLKLLIKLLEECVVPPEAERGLLIFLQNLLNPCEKKTRRQAADYLGVSVSTFDNYVRNGLIPVGLKIDEDQRTLYWNLYDLLKFREK